MTDATTPEPRTAKRSRLDVGAFTAAEVQTMARAIGASVDQVRRLTECAVTIGNLQRVEAQARPVVASEGHEHLYRLMTDALDRPTTGFIMCECGDVQSIAYDDMADKIERDIPQARAALASDAGPEPLKLAVTLLDCKWRDDYAITSKVNHLHRDGTRVAHDVTEWCPDLRLGTLASDAGRSVGALPGDSYEPPRLRISYHALDVERLARAWGEVMDGRRVDGVRLDPSVTTADDWQAIAAAYDAERQGWLP